MDDASSYMCSQNGSPFKKQRRTREERRKKVNDGKKENINHDNTLNISPVKKQLLMNYECGTQSLVTPAKDGEGLIKIQKSCLNSQTKNISGQKNRSSHKLNEMTASKDQTHHILKDSSNIMVE